MKKKAVFLLIIAGLSIVTFGQLTYKAYRPSKAMTTANAVHTINASFSPSSYFISSGQQTTVKLILTPADSNDTIGSFFIDLSSGYDADIIAALDPTGPGGAAITSQKVINSVSGGYATLAYQISPPYPKSVEMSIVVKKYSDYYNDCTLSVDQTYSSVYTNDIITDGYHTKYVWGTIGKFSCQFGQSVSTTPGATTIPNTTTTPITSATPNPTTIVSGIPTLTPGGTCKELPAPSNLTPSGTIYVTAAGQKIAWDPVAGTTYYGVEIWQGAIVTDAQGNQTIKYSKIFTSSTADNFYIYTQFAQDTRYIIKVSAIDACNNSWTQTQSTVLVAGVAPTFSPTPTPSLTPQPYPTATPTVVIPPVTIKMRLRFQGIYTKPALAPKAPQVFLVWVRNADRENPIYKWVTAKYDQIGSWYISDTWNLVPGDGYKVWIKGEKSLQRKICDGRPSDQESGFYHCGNDNGNIVIQPGENYLDFSNVILFAGDIPFKGEGDGVLDSFDLAYIATHFGDTTNDIGDINYDGITDSQDYGLAVNAIRIQKYDETYPYKIHPFFRNVPLHPQYP